MKTLRKIIRTYMYQITGLVAFLILILLLLHQITSEQKYAYDDAMATFTQIEQLLLENQQEIEEIQKEYTQTCLYNAETVARIIEGDPAVLYDVDALKEIAETVELDEIHIFDQTGRIFTGTHPEYYDFTFDSGEQMNFFKPMLTNKELKLVQDITPNTAEGKSMQYSAVWSDNGEFIVQIGIEPVKVMKETEKNEISYIFSSFSIISEADYYAVDAESGRILGSTDSQFVGQDLSAVGIKLENIANKSAKFHQFVNGKYSYCIFKKVGSAYMGEVIASGVLYQRIPSTAFFLCMGLFLVSIFVSLTISQYMDKYVVDNIHEINQKLQSIANGNLEETININSSVEFADLSDYINEMVKKLSDHSRKMSYALSKTNVYIGVYEYNSHMSQIHFTKQLPEILSLDEHTMNDLASHIDWFNAFLDGIKKNPFSAEEGIYQKGDRYIKLEESRKDNEVLGVVMDVTSEIIKRRELETERDTDVLTGLYNRYGLDRNLTELFRHPEKLGYSAMAVIDCDGLKEVNDTNGHEVGDCYLKKVASLIQDLGTRKSIAARQGGDEFVLFLYDYEREEDLFLAIENLKQIQTIQAVCIEENVCVPIRFSMGYVLREGNNDYQQLIKEADKKMYENKLERKKQQC